MTNPEEMTPEERAEGILSHPNAWNPLLAERIGQAIRQAVEAEREACAQQLAEWARVKGNLGERFPKMDRLDALAGDCIAAILREAAAAIRARKD